MLKKKYWNLEKNGGIYWLKLNRPKKMNSFNEKVSTELEEYLRELKNDNEIRILIISSDNEKYFSTGADIDWFIEITGNQAEEISVQSHKIFGSLEKMSFPVIGAVKGLCLTAGLELILCCDMIYAADNAKFGQIETKFGITPGGGGTQRLTRLIGPNKTKELIFSSKIIDAKEADRIGLVNAIFPLEGFDEKIADIARKILLNSKDAIAKSKILVEKAVYYNEDGFISEEKIFNERFSSKEPRKRLNYFKKQQKR